MLLLLAGLAGGAGATVYDAGHYAARRRGDELLYYPAGPAIRKASLGHTSTAADIAWLRTIQYYGLHKKGDRNYEMMAHLVEIITGLDPHFVNAYIFGGLVTAQDAGDPDRAVALMEKGVAANPQSWEMAFETGFVYYICRAYEPAARHFERAVKLPGAPEKAMRFAAAASARAGDPRMALTLWKMFAGTTNNAEMREKAAAAIKKLEGEVARDAR